MTKEKMKEVRDTLKVEEYSGTIEHILKRISDFIEPPEDAVDFEVHWSFEKNYGYYDDIEPYLEVRIRYKIPYTEEELTEIALKAAKATATRLKNEREAAKKKEAEEKALYEELKKKFESESE